MVWELSAAVLITLFLWWFSTGVILYVDRLPRRTFAASLAAATILAVVGAALLFWSADAATATGAYAGFVGALLIWGWHELAFLMGVITGPRRGPCPEGARGWRRFRMATETVIHHELALFVTLLALALLFIGAENRTGLYAFAVLWCMRLSAKLNIFLGAPNVPAEFLPAHLEYLKSYFKVAPMNPLFPISVTLGALAAGWLALLAAAPALHAAWWDVAISAEIAAYHSTANALLAALLALAVLEHWMLVLPTPDAALWRWALRDQNLAQHDRIVTTETGS